MDFFVFDIQKGDKNNKKEVFNSKFTMRWALGIKRQFKCGKWNGLIKKCGFLLFSSKIKTTFATLGKWSLRHCRIKKGKETRSFPNRNPFLLYSVLFYWLSERYKILKSFTGIDGTLGYLIPETSWHLSSSIKNQEQRRRAILSEQDFWVKPLRSSRKTLQRSLTWINSPKSLSWRNKIGVMYNEAVKVLNTYHSVATAQRMLGKLETYSQFLVRLQQQAVLLTKSLESRHE